MLLLGIFDQWVMDTMKFWIIDHPQYQSIVQEEYINGYGDHPYGLPGIDCKGCGQIWSKYPINNLVELTETIVEKSPEEAAGIRPATFLTNTSRINKEEIRDHGRAALLPCARY